MLHDRNKKLSDRRVKEHMKSDKDLKRKESGRYTDRFRTWIWSMMWLVMGFCVTILILNN